MKVTNNTISYVQVDKVLNECSIGCVRQPLQGLEKRNRKKKVRKKKVEENNAEIKGSWN